MLLRLSASVLDGERLTHDAAGRAVKLDNIGPADNTQCE
jgi:hypothetical protein